MRRPNGWLMAIACVMLLSACAASTSQMAVSTISGIEALQDTLDYTGADSPTVEQYRRARADFLAGMSGILAEQEKQSKSTVGRVKNIVASVGVLLGLAGTIASQVVDDEDDQATIAQTSALVASISGIVALLPIGKVPKGAESIKRYLEYQIPQFEERWPADVADPLTADEWAEFSRDTEQMERVVAELGK